MKPFTSSQTTQSDAYDDEYALAMQVLLLQYLFSAIL